MTNAKSRAKSDAWAQNRQARQDLFDGYKAWQRRAIILSIHAKRKGLDLDWILTADYETLTKELNRLMEVLQNG